MKYLLDVNALIAWRHANAHGHAAFHAWAKADGFKALATCAHAELGFHPRRFSSRHYTG